MDGKADAGTNIDGIAELRGEPDGRIACVARAVQSAEGIGLDRRVTDPFPAPAKLDIHALFRMVAEGQRRIHVVLVEAAENLAGRSGAGLADQQGRSKDR